MKYLIILLALLGAGAAGYLGYTWRERQTDPKFLDQLKIREEKLEAHYIGTKPLSPDDVKQFEEDREKFKHEDKYWFMIGAAGAGLLGALFLLPRWGILSAILMIPLPIYVGYYHLDSMMFTGILIVAGVFSVFIWPKGKEETPPKRRYEESAREGPNPFGDDASEEAFSPSFDDEEAGQVATGAPKTVTRLRCIHCSAILRTAKPVPVGKKMRCANCSKVTPIRAMSAAEQRVSASGPSRKAETYDLEDEPAGEKATAGGPSAILGWFFFLLALGGSGALIYLKISTTMLNF